LAELGVAFFGNIKVLKRIEGGGRDDAFAQLYSRLSMRLIRPVPLKADAIALAAAWDIHDEALVAFIVRIATIGGLRGATFAVELAKMIALGERRALALDDLQAAWSQLDAWGAA
jgi:DNA transposition AAA+ family ATPase